MGSAKLLILENRLGQRVRTFQVESETLNLVYRLDNKRVEAVADLRDLQDAEIEYKLLKTVPVKQITSSGVALQGGLGTLRLVGEGRVTPSPEYQLAEEDDRGDVAFWMKRSAAGHGIAVMLLIAITLIIGHLAKKEEPALVTIVVPPKLEKPSRPVERIRPSEQKIQPRKTQVKVAQKTVQPKNPSQTKRPVVRPPTPVTEKRIVRNDKPRDLNRVGALAVLGGVKNAKGNAQGLDLNSMKNIRSAGTGVGGGGVGQAGRGGVSGVLPGQGLIAGSSGQGAKAQSAGGYGTKGVGGGKAGYGKISLVGSVSGISLPLEEEATVAGGLDRDQIAAVINRNRGQIVYCYEQGLQGQPNLSGRVAVDFVIGANGRISKAKIAQTSLGSQMVESCILAKMKNWQFPRPVGKVNVDVLYPFELRRVSSR